MEGNPRIDLSRYPIDALGSPERGHLVSSCRAAIADTGACVLEGFVPPAAVADIGREVEPCLHRAFYKTKRHNVYLDDGRSRLRSDPSAKCAPDHRFRHPCLRFHPPRQEDWIRFTTGLPCAASWPTPWASMRSIRTSTTWPPVNVLVYPPGTGTGWHFDIAEFVVTLLIRSPQEGGVYEYAPFIRTREDEGFDAVGAILAGGRHGVRELSLPEGALVIFKGHHTLHRVTPIEGDVSRLVGVLSYAGTPGRKTNEYNRRTFYGRSD